MIYKSCEEPPHTQITGSHRPELDLPEEEERLTVGRQ